jgi:peptidoglycan/LPS O-acetylase OafA/YrhL
VKDWIDGLDVLRALAICLVIGRHAARQLGDSTNGLSIGWLGVDLFCVVSGFVVTRSLLTRGADGYYASRAMRILPPYYGVLALYASGLLRPSFEHTMTWRDWLIHATLMTDYANSRLSPVFWSLGAEAKFYILAPLLACVLRHANGVSAFMVLAACFVAPLSFRCITLLLAGPPDTEAVFFFLYRSPFPAIGECFAVGVLLAYLHWKGKLTVSPRLRRALICCPLLGISLLVTGTVHFTPTGYFAATALSPVVAGAWGMLVLATISTSERQCTRAARLAQGVGRVSYSMYLLHMPILVWLSGSLPGWTPNTDARTRILVLFVLGLCVATVTATAWYVLLEWPSTKCAQRLRKSNERPPADCLECDARRWPSAV